MAEGMLRAKLGVLGLEQGAIIDSVGMHAEVGRSPESFAVELAVESGADIAGLLSRPFELDDFSRFDYFIAMDFGHSDYLRSTCPDGHAVNIQFLLDDVGDFKEFEVPDPYWRDRNDYEFAARLINTGTGRLIQRVCATEPVFV
jgi:protein-tyrosine phosphatase